jgi:hypothetical protein
MSVFTVSINERGEACRRALMRPTDSREKPRQATNALCAPNMRHYIVAKKVPYYYVSDIVD